jgi:hypothetical protein
MDIFVTLQDVGRLVKDVVEELGHQEGSPLVLFTRHVHLVLEFNVVRLEQLVLALGPLEFLLDLFQLMLQEVDKILIGLVIGRKTVIFVSVRLPVGLATTAHAFGHE